MVHIPKETKGEHFANLGMLTTLLAPRKQAHSGNIGQGPSIEVLQSSTEDADVKDGPCNEDPFDVDVKTQDWTSGETLQWNSEEPNEKCEAYGYGFLNKQSNVFLKLQVHNVKKGVILYRMM